MRGILVGAMVVAMAAGPAFAGTAGEPCGAWHDTNPSGAVVDEHYPSAGADFGLGLAATGLSLIYTPFRAVYGIVGAALGGLGGWSTGGDLRTAKALWRPTVEGQYYVRPDHLDGRERFRFNGASPKGPSPATLEAEAGSAEPHEAVRDDASEESGDTDEML